MEIRQQLVMSRDRTYGGVNPGDFLTFHETDNASRGAGAQAHANLQSSGNVRAATWHLQGDDKVIVRSFLPEVQCWHAGDGRGPGNLTSEAYEICVNPDSDYDAALALAAAYGRDWRRRTGHGRDRIVQHNHWSGKDCPRILRGMGPAAWAAFVASTDPDPEEVSVQFVNPLAGVVTSGYNPTRVHPTLKRVVPHWGTDIGARPRGSQGVIGAIADGTVLYVRTGTRPGSTNGGYLPRLTGDQVVIDHGSFRKRTLRSYYGHFSKVFVEVGQKVKAGEALGLQGATGNVDGAHLHLEIWVGGQTVDPDVFMTEQGVSLGSGPTAPKAPVNPIPKDWFTMATPDELRAVVREEVARILDRSEKTNMAVGRIEAAAVPAITGSLAALTESVARVLTDTERLPRIADRSEKTNQAVGRLDRTVPGIAEKVGAPVDTGEIAKAVVDQIGADLDQVITAAVTNAVADLPQRDLEQIVAAARADLKTRLEN